MAHITKAYYDSICSTPISEAEFTPMAERASDIVDALTFGAVERFELVEGDVLFTRVKKATAYQCDFIQRSFGSLDAWENDAANDTGSENIGNYSYSKSAQKRDTVGGLAVSPHLATILSPVIALGRRVGC